MPCLVSLNHQAAPELDFARNGSFAEGADDVGEERILARVEGVENRLGKFLLAVRGGRESRRCRLGNRRPWCRSHCRVRAVRRGGVRIAKRVQVKLHRPIAFCIPLRGILHDEGGEGGMLFAGGWFSGKSVGENAVRFLDSAGISVERTEAVV